MKEGMVPLSQRRVIGVRAHWSRSETVTESVELPTARAMTSRGSVRVMR
ncbi:MAG: hypothetical protein IPN17_21705 [Deltaproteobacteria bacterium]|nr:hypothetical protein [Deltaproteobacteria bacterium]